MMFPKHPRVQDKAGTDKVKAIDHCERCGGYSYLETAHVIGKGAWGPDIKENCLKLCGPASMGIGCHGADHRGEIEDDELFSIIARREEKSLDEIKQIVHDAWRCGVYDQN